MTLTLHIFALLLIAILFINTIQSKENYLKMIRRQPHLEWRNKIVCQVCKQMTKELNLHSRVYREEWKRTNVIPTEDHYLNRTTEICNPYHNEGEWMTKYDLVKQPPKLILRKMNDWGRCNRECETISAACAYVLDYDALYEKFAEFLYKEYSTSKIQVKACKKICKQEKSDVTADSEMGDEQFMVIDEQQRSMFKSFVLGEQEKKKNPGPMDYDEDELEKWVHDYAKQEKYKTNLEVLKIKRRKKMCEKGARTGDDCIFEEEKDEEENKEDEEVTMEDVEIDEDEELDEEGKYDL